MPKRSIQRKNYQKKHTTNPVIQAFIKNKSPRNFFCIFVRFIFIYPMTFCKKFLFRCFVVLFSLGGFAGFAQKTTDSYPALWKTIQNDTVSNTKKIQYLETYLQKARLENNPMQAYRALEKESFLVSFDDAVLLLHQMKPLVATIGNDSLQGSLLNRSTVLYYKNRFFEKALNYAIQSEAFNEKINNLYNLSGARIDIGNIYFHTRDYEKAEEYFLQAKAYYKNQKGYNHRRGYMVTLYCLGKTYWAQGNTDALAQTIAENIPLIQTLKPAHQVLETAYLNYLKGGHAFLQNNFAAAQTYFENALPTLQQNKDFTNEHVVYLYLGKILWQQNQKEEAVGYFNKIDALFHEQKFLNYELRDTYDYLIAYYKETKQPQQQLQATESLIALTQQFEREQQNMTKTMHYQLETQKLEASRKALQTQLHQSQNTAKVWFAVLGLVLLLVVSFAGWQLYEKRRLKGRFDLLLINIKADKPLPMLVQAETIIEVETIAENTPSAQKLLPPHEPAPETAEPEVTTKEDNFATTATEIRLLKKLELFEKQKEFLKPKKLEDLVSEFGTNRNTLSALLNKKYGGFASYLNKLRIGQAMVDLTKKPDLRSLPMEELAIKYGFANAKTFRNQFKVVTNIPPTFFIKELEREGI